MEAANDDGPTVLKPGDTIVLIFRRPPGPDSDLIEIEDGEGNSIQAGEWRQRPDGWWELVIRVGD